MRRFLYALLVSGFALSIGTGDALAGVSSYEQISVSSTLPPNSTDQIRDAACPAGKSVLGGGWSVLDGVYNIIERSNSPITDNIWRVWFQNPNGFKIRVQVIAICAIVS